MTAFEELKEICRVACHERNACEPGFKALMQTETVGQILAVRRENWQDVYVSRYHDIIARNIPLLTSEEFRTVLRENQVYVNESAQEGLMIVSNPATEVVAGGNAVAYIFGGGRLTATDNAEAHCRSEAGELLLRGHASGFMETGRAEVTEFASLQGVFRGECRDAARVNISGGSLCDYGHLEITAWRDATVYSDSRRKITIMSDTARLLPLAEYKEETA